jgi:hypothetical protein
MKRMLWRTVSLILPAACLAASPLAMPFQQPPASAATPPATSAPAASKIWIGHYAEYEEFLRTVEIVRTEGFKKGVTGKTKHAFLKPGGLTAEGALRTAQPGFADGFFESHKSEPAAYRLDRLLELDMVPPTVERRYNGEAVSLQLFIPNTKDLRDVTVQKLRAPDPERWNYQLHRAYMFDDLVANIDDNATNLMFDPQWNLIKIDCSRCFTNRLVQPFGIGTKFNQIDRPFFERVKALDKATVAREIGDLVEGGAVDALFARRDAIVKAFEKLAMQKGGSQVFVP